jgi:hypothetical protein
MARRLCAAKRTYFFAIHTFDRVAAKSASTPASAFWGNDANNVLHGFLRGRDGKFTHFQAPGADTTAGSFNGTIANGINDLGEVTGYYFDVTGSAHGFLRSVTGQFKTFDVPGSAGFTDSVAINLEGAVVGYYLDASSQFHAFLRKPDGTFVSFDGPDACNTGTPNGCFGSAAFNINIFGTVAAAYEDNSANFVNHGLVRAPNGRLISYAAPGAGSGPSQGTNCPGCSIELNASGVIAGIYTDSNTVFHGYLRSPEGTITSFDAPNAGTASFQGTGCFSDCAVGLNDLGEVTGNYIDSAFNYHGFFRAANGKIQSFDPLNSIGTSATAAICSSHISRTSNCRLRWVTSRARYGIFANTIEPRLRYRTYQRCWPPQVSPCRLPRMRQNRRSNMLSLPSTSACRRTPAPCQWSGPTRRSVSDCATTPCRQHRI